MIQEFNGVYARGGSQFSASVVQGRQCNGRPGAWWWIVIHCFWVHPMVCLVFRPSSPFPVAAFFVCLFNYYYYIS